MRYSIIVDGFRIGHIDAGMLSVHGIRAMKTEVCQRIGFESFGVNGVQIKVGEIQ